MAEATDTTPEYQTFNPGGNYNFTMAAVMNNYSAVVGVVNILLQLTANQSTLQVDLGNEFEQNERSSGNNGPTNNGGNGSSEFTNYLYQLEHDGDSDNNTSQDSAGYQADQAMFNTQNTQLSGFITQLNQIVSQDTSGESTITQTGTALTNFAANLVQQVEKVL